MTRAWLLVIIAALAVPLASCVNDFNSAPPEPQPQPVRSEKHAYGDHPAQYGQLTTPTRDQTADSIPVVVLVHGGFWSEPWDLTLMQPLADDLVSRGYAVWNIEFRRLGGQGGWPNTFDDVSDAIDFLATLSDDYDLDLSRTALVGHSSGGHLALWALDRADADVSPIGVVGLGAITDLESFGQSESLLGGTQQQVPDRYLAAAPILDPDRMRLIHGANDDIVSEATLSAAKHAGLPLTLVADTDHFDVIDPITTAWDLALRDIAELLDS